MFDGGNHGRGQYELGTAAPQAEARRAPARSVAEPRSTGFVRRNLRTASSCDVAHNEAGAVPVHGPRMPPHL
jgi:hypothetical protein